MKHETIYKSIALFAVCLSLTGCTKATLEDYVRATDDPTVTFTQKIPQNLCGTYYHVKEWNSSDEQVTISSEGYYNYKGIRDWSGPADKYIDYADKSIYDNDCWGREKKDTVYTFDDNYLIFTDTLHSYSWNDQRLVILSKNPDAPMPTFDNEISGTWKDDNGGILCIDKGGTMKQSYYEGSYLHYLEAYCLCKGGSIYLSDNLWTKYGSTFHYCRYKVDGDNLSIDEYGYKLHKVKEIPTELCGVWYKSNNWGSDSENQITINPNAICTNAQNSYIGIMDYPNMGLGRYNIVELKEDFMILENYDYSYNEYAIYSREADYNLMSPQTLDPNIVGTWTIEDNPNSYITIETDGVFRKGGSNSVCFTYNGFLYLNYSLGLPYRNTYTVEGNTLNINGTIYTRKESTTE